ncbi:CaiB/BaiF CoA transferase family protein [Nocardiopsis dassonvillei]|uniref:CaiB/BaiF CoA transferase family protein n=1 Tax=Nocardiopsis dassonvillei TaxID=2014 RepID=UPI00366DAA1B
MNGPLEGIRVLDLTTTFSGPYCTRLLADMGAEVLKVEAPGGDITRGLGTSRAEGMASVHVAANHGKDSVLLDLKSPEGARRMRELLLRADCLVHNMRVRAADRLGVGADAALRANPALVHVAVTAYGSDGPYAGRPAYDDIIQAATGLAWLQSLGADDPAYMSTAVADKVAGLAAANAVTAALYARERTGRGQAVEVPMYETLAGFALMEQWGGRAFIPPEGPTGYARMRSPHRRPYRTRDGLLSVVVYHQGHWRRFLEHVGRADLLQDERYRTVEARSRNIDDLYALLETLIAQRTTREWLEVLAELDIPAVPVRTLDDLFDDNHLKTVGFFREAEGDDGRYLVARSATRFDGTPAPSPTGDRGPQALDAGRATMDRWLAGPPRMRARDGAEPDATCVDPLS